MIHEPDSHPFDNEVGNSLVIEHLQKAYGHMLKAYNTAKNANSHMDNQCDIARAFADVASALDWQHTIAAQRLARGIR